MFTGLVQEVGRVEEVAETADGARLAVSAPLSRELAAGDSVAVNGVCLTATDIADGSFRADVMHETLRRSSLGRLAEGATVNLELPLRPVDRLGGHIVQGHVDGLGTVVEVSDDGFSRVVTIAVDEPVLRYVVPKGSIAVDGISLTVSDVTETTLSVSLIPETLQRTNLGDASPGTVVNVEVDVLAKYVERLVTR